MSDLLRREDDKYYLDPDGKQAQPSRSEYSFTVKLNNTQNSQSMFIITNIQ